MKFINCLFTTCLFVNIAFTQNLDLKKVLKISHSRGFLSIPNDLTSFGRGTSFVGDIDKDGIEELAIAAYDNQTLEGVIVILFLTDSFTVKKYSVIGKDKGGINGVSSNMQQFGTRSISKISDLDKDGINEIIVGNNTGGNNNTGQVFILYLNELGLVKKLKIIGSTDIPLSSNDYFGSSVSTIRDIDKDGIQEIIVGSPYDDSGGGDKGALYVLFIDSNASIKRNQKINSTNGNFTGQLQGGAQFGRVLCTLYNFNNDTLPDFVCGSLGNSSELWVLNLDSVGKVNSYQKIDNTIGGFINYDTIKSINSIACVGDINGDNINDIMLGDITDSINNVKNGNIKLVLLNENGFVVGVKKLNSTTLLNEIEEQQFFGFSLTGQIDFNGDFKNDIIVGSPRRDDGGTDKGAIYLLSLDGAVHPTPPKALWRVNTTSGNQNTVFNFTQYSTGFPSAYKWTISPNTFAYQSGTSDTSANPIIKFNETANYSVQLKVTNPFSADSLLRNSYISVQKVGVNNIDKNNAAINIYPNPSNGLVQIQSPVTIQSILVFDITGKQLLHQAPHAQTDEINISYLPQGLYQILVQTTTGVFVKKLMKE